MPVGLLTGLDVRYSNFVDDNELQRVQISVRNM